MYLHLKIGMKNSRSLDERKQQQQQQKCMDILIIVHI